MDDWRYSQKHLLGIEGMHALDINLLLDEAEVYAEHNRQTQKRKAILKGLTQINMFFENSTRTLMSFDLAGKRLGADTISLPVSSSSIKKGETLLDTALTLNAMRPDVIVIRHGSSGAVKLIADNVDCAVINAGDGRHEHPTQALLDALTIRHRKGKIEGLIVAICGDILHSRVARSNIHLLLTLGAIVRLVGPPTLLPPHFADLGASIHHDMESGLKDADIVMMLRLQQERMDGAFLPSTREYFRTFGLTDDKLAHAKPDAVIMHPGPMNRGVEIDTHIADDLKRSGIAEQVEMGVAVRMACLDVLTRDLRAEAADG
ncbi:MAG: aspartate carbamoyltransferase catalytic subunit [Sphingomonadales bacterium]